MKQLFYSLTLAAFVLNISSCKKNDIQTPDQAATSLAASPSIATRNTINNVAVLNASKVIIPGMNSGISRGGGGAAFGDGSGCTACLLQYPDNSNLPRSGVVFSESDELVGSDPGPGTCSVGTKFIKLWYSDEHAMTLGVRQVIIKTHSGSVATNYPFTVYSGTPQTIQNPHVGTTIPTGDQSGNDISAGGGRPLWPVLYVTDISWGPNRSGDWQQAGNGNEVEPVGFAPTSISGAWKAAVRTVDYTTNPVSISVQPDADPVKNHWNLGAGDPPPAGVVDDGYGCEAVWDVTKLHLQAGHKYRILFMVHDGDQNKAGGDAGEACITIMADSNNSVHSPD